MQNCDSRPLFSSRRSRGQHRSHLDASIVRCGEEREAVRSESESRYRVLMSSKGFHQGIGSTVPDVDKPIPPPRREIPPIAARSQTEYLLSEGRKSMQSAAGQVPTQVPRE